MVRFVVLQVVEEYCGSCSGQGLLEKTKQVKVRGMLLLARDYGNSFAFFVVVSCGRSGVPRLAVAQLVLFPARF